MYSSYDINKEKKCVSAKEKAFHLDSSEEAIQNKKKYINRFQ